MRILKTTRCLDSFIREVMRMRGDIIMNYRVATRTAKVGGYTIPKSSTVVGLVNRINRDSSIHGSDANDFHAQRWIASGKAA